MLGEVFNQEIRSVQRLATGTALGAGAVVTGLFVASAAAGGSVTLRDGGAAGTIKTVLTFAAVAGGFMIPIPGGKMTFGTDIYVVMDAGIDSVTVFYR